MRIFRGSSPPVSVPLPTPAPVGRTLVDALATDGGFAFWVSGGNTTRGPVLALTSTGCSSRDTTRSADLSPTRSVICLLEPSPAPGGITLFGPVSALMTGGSPLRGEPTNVL